MSYTDSGIFGCNNYESDALQKNEGWSLMATYKEHRRENLRALETKFGSLEALSDAVGVSASYLSQMKKVRQMGDKVARRIEKKLNLPSGSMDVPPGNLPAERNNAPGAAAKAAVPHYAPDAKVQELLEDLLNLPPGMREYIRRKARILRAYADKLSPFQRNNWASPPEDSALYAEWERELEAELARSNDNPSAAQKPRPTKERAK